MRRALAALAAVAVALTAAAVVAPPLWAQAPEATTTTAPDPAAVATAAAAEWSPPKPRIRTNPPPERPQVAGLPTWLWVEPASPLRLDATEGFTAVALEARVASVRFDFGDGTSLTCAGTGTPYDPSRPEASQSSECTHAFRATSGGGTLAVRATVTWALFHDGRQVATRQSSSNIDVAVAEAQALDRRPDAISGAEAAAGADAHAGGDDGSRPLGELDELGPEDDDDKPWWRRALEGVGDFFVQAPGRVWGGVSDLAAGIWDGIAGPLAFVWEFSTLRALVDPDGFSASVKALTEAFTADPWGFLKDMGKALVGWQDFADGKPLRAIGSWIPGLALALLTGGGSLASKAAQGGRAASRGVRGVDEVADAGKGARGAGAATASKRLPQDIAVNPKPPAQKPTNRPVGRNPVQNQAVQDRVAELRRLDADDIRVDQQQVNADRVRVGTNRPDLQYTLDGKRYYEEYDVPSSDRGPAHKGRLEANDPDGEVILHTVPETVG